MLRRPRQPRPLGTSPGARRGARPWTAAACLGAVTLATPPAFAAPPGPAAVTERGDRGDDTRQGESARDSVDEAADEAGDEAAAPADDAEASAGTSAATAGQRAESKAGPESDDVRPTAPVPSPDVDAKVHPSAAGEGGDPQRAASPGGVGNVVDADDPDAKKATAELEGEQLGDDLPPGVPERMAPMQAAAWWTMFGAVTLGATGGVFAGLAEREEDQARRLQRTFDSETGARLSFADVKDDYDASVRRGTAYAWTSRGVLIAGGALLVTSVALFAVHAKRRRAEGAERGREQRRARIDKVGAGYLEVSF